MDLTLVLVLVATLGVAAQWLAWRFHMRGWKGSALKKGMRAVHARIEKLARTLRDAPPDIRVDYDVPGAPPLHGLRQRDYRFVFDDPARAVFSLRSTASASSATPCRSTRGRRATNACAG